MIFGLETFKDLAAVPIIIVIITKTLQMDVNAFAQFQFADPRDLLINFCILTNDSNGEIISPEAENLEISQWYKFFDS